MPRYDYQCVQCWHEFELVQRVQEAGSGTCPKCSGNGRRVFHAVPVIYKGSGFYTTDYGRPKSPPPEKEKKEKEPAKSATSESSNGPAAAGESKAESSSSASSAKTSE